MLQKASRPDLYPEAGPALFRPEELIEDCIEGLEVYAIRARTLTDKAIALGREGETMYVWPVPWPWNFRS